MKILFYGSLNASAPETALIRPFVSALTECLLEDPAIVIVTREGDGPTKRGETISIDNIVLDAACAYRNANGRPKDCIVSYADPRRFHKGDYCKLDRKITILPVTHRYAMYREMLEETDVLVTIGGKEGVYRLGLFAAALQTPVIPIGCTGGKSRDLYDEITTAGCLPTDKRQIRDILGGATPPSTFDVRQLAATIQQIAREHGEKRRALSSDVASAQPKRLEKIANSLTVADWLAICTVVVALMGAAVAATWTIADKLQSAKIDRFDEMAKELEKLRQDKAVTLKVQQLPITSNGPKKP